MRLEMMGQTLDGHDLDILIIGAPGAINKQHAYACGVLSSGATRTCCLSLHVICLMSSRVERRTSAKAAQDQALHGAGEPAPEKRKVWVIARQHPGETMAEFFAEVGPITIPSRAALVPD